MKPLFRFAVAALLLLACADVVAADKPTPVRADSLIKDPSARVKDFAVQDVPLDAALRILAKQFGLSIITARSVSTNVTASFKDVSLEEALNSLVTINGFAYRTKGAVIEVYTPAAGAGAAASRPLVQTFDLEYANAEKLKAMLKPFLSGDTGKIEADVGGNRLIVYDLPFALESITKIIEDIDKPEPQVTISAEIIEAAVGVDEKLGIDWTTRVRAHGAARPVTFPFTSDVSSSKWVPGNNVADGEFSATDSFPFPEPNDFTFGTIDATGLSALLDVLRSDDGTNLIANPEITTLNNHEAKINLGQITPVAEFTTNLETGVAAVTGFIDIETGTILTVTPQINEKAGYIKMRVKPEISEILGFVGQFDERPIIASRKAETTVRVRDGETLVIGGLVSEKNVETVNKIPFFGDIPVLGWFFKSTHLDKKKSSLYIFVTPRIMTDQGYRKRADQAGKRLERNGLKEKPDTGGTDLRTPGVPPFADK
jgi:type IV pilus assembly protein PilQ